MSLALNAAGFRVMGAPNTRLCLRAAHYSRTFCDRGSQYTPVCPDGAQRVAGFCLQPYTCSQKPRCITTLGRSPRLFGQTRFLWMTSRRSAPDPEYAPPPWPPPVSLQGESQARGRPRSPTCNAMGLPNNSCASGLTLSAFRQYQITP